MILYTPPNNIILDLCIFYPKEKEKCQRTAAPINIIKSSAVISRFL